MNELAKRESWKTLDPPERREELRYECSFDSAQSQKIRRGLIPREMEDKWFIFFEDGWLYFHRSWTGALIYWIKLEETEPGAQVVESWVSRDHEQYRETDTAYDQRLLAFLVEALLLGIPAEFPVRSKDIAGSMPGVFQHHIVGRAYPEKAVEEDD